MSLLALSTPASAVESVFGFKDSATVNFTIQVILSPGLTIQKVSSPASYTGIGRNITYIYTITNSGFINFNGNIIVKTTKLEYLIYPTWILHQVKMLQ
jgi:hypothetical protein